MRKYSQSRPFLWKKKTPGKRKQPMEKKKDREVSWLSFFSKEGQVMI